MVITETIISNGTVLKPGDYNLISIDTTSEFNKIPRAELKLSDGSWANQRFKTLDDTIFLPGKVIEIFLKEEGKPKSERRVFAGVVVNHDLERSMHRSILTIELSDISIQMTRLRKNRVFKGSGKKNNISDDKIIKELIGKHKDFTWTYEDLTWTHEGLTLGEITPTTLAHTQMVQYYTTDWDFMLSRAEANGLLVTSDAGKLSVVKPAIENTTSLIYEFGRTLDEFNLRFNSHAQFQEVTSFGLVTENDELSLKSSKKGEEHVLGTVDLKVEEKSSVKGANELQQVHAVPSAPKEMESWSNAQTLKSRMSLVLGTVQIGGDGDVKVGQTIKLENVSRFSGKHLVSGVRHSYTKDSGWRTHLQIGMDSESGAAKSDVIDTKAAGLLPGVNGLQVGIVHDTPDDTVNGFQVLVNIPAFNQGDESAQVLAMYTSIDVGADHGVIFPPLKGDRVVVGFLNDDPRQAIILGSMHSHKAPNENTNKNKYKGIFTRSNYQLLFDEETELVTLSTADENNANENKICIDQKNKAINLEDANGNKILLNKDGITITSTGDCQIKTDGDFGIDAKGKVKIKGKKVDLI